MNDPFDLDSLPVFSDAPAAQEDVPPPYLDGLNDPQTQAVQTLEGPVLVLAGAGTGKTRVLTTRISHLLAMGRAYPSQILAVTFTNKAALEMKERIGKIIGSRVEDMYWMGTFHSICVKILRKYSHLVGLESNYVILDSDDQLRLIKQIIREAGIDEKRYPPRSLAGLIDKWKNRGLKPSQVPQKEAFDYADGKAIDFYRIYQSRLKTLNAADFGDLLLHVVDVFQSHPEVLSEYQQRFRYILVDEYQDTNISQYLWLRLLAQKSQNICCVGDDDQSIYGWRGAEVGNILRFESDFKNAAIIRLEQNYRSTEHILGTSGHLISHNSDRLGKTLWTAQKGGDKVSINGVWDGRAEASAVGDMVEELQRKNIKLSEMAVLVRASFQMREFEERFITLGVPYRIIGGPRFYERQEIRDVLAYLRVVYQASDDLAFERIINTPKRGLATATLQKLHIIARENECPLTSAAKMIVETDELRPKARGSLKKLIENFDRWRSLSEAMGHAELTENILRESGYMDMWKNDKSPDAEGRLENISEMIKSMDNFEGLAEFLEHISLIMDNIQDLSQDKVNIMTLHGSKGLEFDIVFLPGWEEELFPSKKTLEESGENGLEEERRLAYVGITRAKKQVHIFHVASRYMFGNYTTPLPSRFISELPEAHSETRMQQGLGRSGNDFSDYGYTKNSYYSSENNSDPKNQRFGSQNSYQLDRTRAKKTLRSTYQKPVLQNSSHFKIGERVFHDKFGYGIILKIEGTKLKIDFENGSARKVMEAFVTAS